MKNLILITILLAAACSKDKSDAAATPASEENSQEAKAQATPTPEEKPAPAKAPTPPTSNEAGDYVRVVARHSPAKPDDPVTVEFTSFRVKQAKFDPANLEGATAELEIDLASLSSGIGKRDAHLKSGDYLDVANTPRALVKIADVKKKDETTFSANAEVNAHGATTSLPVEFSVVETSGNTIKVKASKEFSRVDFGIGKAEGDPTDPAVTIELMLTLTAG
jgi:polyisoprenoid-binding protein YceI